MALQFDELQDQVKTKIFSLLTPLERQVIRPVCLDWKELIDEEFGIKLKVNNNMADILVSSAEYAVELELNSLTIPVDGTGMVFTHKLHTLRFHNIVVTYNLFPLLRNFSNSLVTLGFNQIILDLPEQLQIQDFQISLPRLKNLEFQEWNMSDSLVALFYFLNSSVIYGALLRFSVFLHNPSMIPLQLLFTNEVSTAPPMIQLVKKCERTLETFNYGRQNNVIKLKFYPYDSLDHLDSNIPLKEFICNPNYNIVNFKCNPQFKTEWLPILTVQKHLVKIHIGDCRVGMWDGIIATIRNNCESLETFWIAGQSFNQTWNCSVFGDCNRLKKLCVQLYMSPKIHLSALPRTLTALNISGSIKRGELEHLLTMMVLLEEAEFTHLGINQAEDGINDRMDADLFKSYLRLPKLLKISFLHCDWIDQEWDEVIQWCSANTSRGIVFEQLFYPMQGLPIFRHGIHVNIPPSFDRNQIDVNNPDVYSRHVTSTQSITREMCHTLYSALTCWWT